MLKCTLALARGLLHVTEKTLGWGEEGGQADQTSIIFWKFDLKVLSIEHISESVGIWLKHGLHVNAPALAVQGILR